MEEIENAAPNMLPGEIRDYLAKFLFTGDDVFKHGGYAFRRGARPAGAGPAGAARRQPAAAG